MLSNGHYWKINHHRKSEKPMQVNGAFHSIEKSRVINAYNTPSPPSRRITPPQPPPPTWYPKNTTLRIDLCHLHPVRSSSTVSDVVAFHFLCGCFHQIPPKSANLVTGDWQFSAWGVVQQAAKTGTGYPALDPHVRIWLTSNTAPWWKPCLLSSQPLYKSPISEKRLSRGGLAFWNPESDQNAGRRLTMWDAG